MLSLFGRLRRFVFEETLDYWLLHLPSSFVARPYVLYTYLCSVTYRWVSELIDLQAETSIFVRIARSQASSGVHTLQAA